MGDPSYLLSDNQLELCNGIDQAIAAKQVHVVFRCSRRWGKSLTMVVYAIKKCLQNPNYKVQYVAGTIKLVLKVIQPAFKEVFGSCPHTLRDLVPKWNNQLGQYEFSNGSTLAVGGADNNNVDHLLGQAANLIIVDEAGYIKKLQDAVHRVLGPMLATTQGAMVVASTPPADPTHYFHELCSKASAEGFLFHRDIYSCDHGKLTVEWAKAQAGGETTEVWRREWLALPTVDHNLTVFPEFMDLKSELVRKIVRPPHFNYYSRYVVLDYGFAPDATGVLFGYYDYKQATLYIEDEILISRMSTDVLAKTYIKKRDELWPDLDIYKTMADCQQNILTDLYARHKLRFTQFTDKGSGSVLQNANNVNVMLRERRLVIDPRCVNLIAQIEYAQWHNPKKNSQKRELARSDLFQHFDLVAALLYLVRCIDYNYNPLPKLPGFHPHLMVASPSLLQEADIPVENAIDDASGQALADVFGF